MSLEHANITSPSICPHGLLRCLLQLLFVDDCLCIHHSAEEKLKKIDKFFKMKAGSIGGPDVYLGAKVKPTKMNNGVTAWAISTRKYVNEAVINCEKWVQENMPGHKQGNRATNPFSTEQMNMMKTNQHIINPK